MTPKIKPLVWRGDAAWTWKAAQTSIGEYLVQECDCGGTSLKLEGHFAIWHSETRNEQAAQAAAQADYDARIIAALNPAWLAALEAQVKAADGLAETTDTQARLLKDGVGTVKGRINIVADRLLSASATYRAAKETSYG